MPVSELIAVLRDPISIQKHTKELIRRTSRVLKLVVREIVACAVLFPVMDMVSDPDFWNRAIDQVVRGAYHFCEAIS